MPVSRPNPPAGQQVTQSSIAIGKQPMSYPPSTLPAATPHAQPKSARAASKAAVHNQQVPQGQPQQNRHPSPPTSNAGGGGKARAPVSAASNSGGSAVSKGKANANKIWSTSTTEERERIKDFWLGLGEQERRNLVKIEKDTVLKKMKEQQKHSCSCAVCGRKRNAIEEELEVLYDAYYEELEQYANYQQRYVSSGGTIPPPPGPGPFPGSVELDKNGAVVAPAQPNSKRAAAKPPKLQQQPLPPPQTMLPAVTNGHRQHHPHPHPHHHPPANDEDEDEDYDEEQYEDEDVDERDEGEEEGDEDEEGDDDGEDGDEEADEEEEDDEHHQNPKAQARRVEPPANGRRAAPGKGRDGLFNIGSSLTVTGPGNILTVADDLLKNDGQKFLEMMEQLAERRMQREEEAANDVEDESEDESEDDRDASEDGEDGVASEEEEEEEEEPMTEEQKMEEGKRMFSIFAARMFEQRVLTAYREKVAQERQLQLLRELEEEDKSTRDREMKKQTQNQKKKDKKRQQKLAKEEEKAAKTAEKAAEEAAIKAKQIAQEEELRKKREDERIRREAAKRLAEEERLRKEEEKKKRQQEERERELEREKKKREKDERIKKEREEKERKAKEEREVRLAKEREERAERERIEKDKREERERVEKEKRLAKEKEEKAEREAKEKLAAQQRAAAIAQAQANSVKAPVRANATASSSSSSLATPTKVASAPSNNSATSVPRAPNTAVTTNGAVANAKKVVNNKHIQPPSAMPPSGVVGQAPRPHPLPLAPQQMQPQQQQPNMSRPHHLPPLGNMNPQQISPHLPPQSGMMFGHPQGPVMIPPPNMSPRVGNFPPMQYPFNPANMQHHPPPGTPLPSGLSRGFNAGPSFDPNFNRMPMPIGVPLAGSVNIPPGAPSPIGPPKAKPSMSSSVPAPPMLAPGTGRRGSVAAHGDSSMSGPGPITRPIAPIARPIAGGSGEGASSGSGSPNRRSPSPKGILGSSALSPDDDEVVSTAGPRRVGAIGGGMGVGLPSLQNWAPTSPRPGQPAPWGSAGPPGFSPSPARPIANPIGTNNHLHHLHHPGVSPIGGGSLWANSPATNGDTWHPQGPGGFFPGPAYMNHNAAASSTPHASS